MVCFLGIRKPIESRRSDSKCFTLVYVNCWRLCHNRVATDFNEGQGFGRVKAELPHALHSLTACFCVKAKETSFYLTDRAVPFGSSSVPADSALLLCRKLGSWPHQGFQVSKNLEDSTKAVKESAGPHGIKWLVSISHITQPPDKNEQLPLQCGGRPTARVNILNGNFKKLRAAHNQQKLRF